MKNKADTANHGKRCTAAFISLNRRDAAYTAAGTAFFEAGIFFCSVDMGAGYAPLCLGARRLSKTYGYMERGKEKGGRPGRSAAYRQGFGEAATASSL